MFSGNFLKFVSVFLLIMLVAGGGFFVWDRYFSEVARLGREQEAQLKLYNEKEAAYIKAMTEDTYGGKTPQETLDLFVAALRSDDVELASKYFLLDENLSRVEWLNHINKLKENNLVALMANDIEKRSQPDLKNILDENDFKFVLYKNDGKVGARIDMRFNKYSNVWKIESL